MKQQLVIYQNKEYFLIEERDGMVLLVQKVRNFTEITRYMIWVALDSIKLQDKLHRQT